MTQLCKINHITWKVTQLEKMLPVTKHSMATALERQVHSTEEKFYILPFDTVISHISRKEVKVHKQLP